MNNTIFKYSKIALAVSIISGSIMLSGCGSSSSDSGSSTSTVSRGVITGFGSVYVNGIKYETTNTQYSIDNTNETSQDNLRVGMVVTVNGTVNADGTTGVANFIQYDNDLKGPISSFADIDLTTKEITVLGRTITVTSDTVFDDDDGSTLTFATLDATSVGTFIEVSGLETVNGLTATHIEEQNDSEIEILGIVSNFSGVSLDDISFEVYGLTVKTNGLTELDDIALSGLADGVFVEVEGTLDPTDPTGTTLIAQEIEGKTRGLGSDDIDDAEVEGVISGYDALTNTFYVQGQLVDASSPTLALFPSTLELQNGITVEAEGEIVGGVMMAYEVKQKGNKIKIEAPIAAIDSINGTVTFTFNSTDIVVRVNAQTKIEGYNDSRLSFGDLQVGQVVKMKAYNDGTSTINAYELELEDDNEREIQAAVEAFDRVANTITLLGVEFDLSDTIFDNNHSYTPVGDSFYNQLSIGEFVELKDDNNDGIFEQIEMDD